MYPGIYRRLHVALATIGAVRLRIEREQRRPAASAVTLLRLKLLHLRLRRRFLDRFRRRRLHLLTA